MASAGDASTNCTTVLEPSTKSRRENSVDIGDRRPQLFRQASGAHGLCVHAGDPYPTPAVAGGVRRATHLLRKVQTGPTAAMNGNCNGQQVTEECRAQIIDFRAAHDER